MAASSIPYSAIFDESRALDLTASHTLPKTEGIDYLAKKAGLYMLKGTAALFYIPLMIPMGIPKMISYCYNKELNDEIRFARIASFKEGFSVRLEGHENIEGEKIFSEKPFTEWSKETLRSICYGQLLPPRPLTEDRRASEPFRRETQAQVHAFVERVFAIREAIIAEKDPDSIRSMIHEAMSTRVYQQLKTRIQNPAIEILQVLAVRNLCTDGRAALQNYGRKVLGELDKEEFSWGELAAFLDRQAGDSLAFQRNSVGSTILWGLAHPFEALHCTESSWFPLEFNSHQGNPNFYGYDFQLNIGGEHKEMQFYYGPGPTGDLLYNDGVLIWMDKQGVAVHELRQNFQNMHHSAEAMRIFEMLRYEQAHPDSLRLLSTSFDTEAMEMPKSFIPSPFTPQAFMLLYAKYVMSEEGISDTSQSIDEITDDASRHVEGDHREDNGYYVGGKVMTSLHFKDAIKTSEKIYVDLQAKAVQDQIAHGHSHWSSLMELGEKGKQRLGKMMQLGTHAVVSVGAVASSLKEICSKQELEQVFDDKLHQDLVASRVSGACKQDIDRAVVENVSLRLFFRLLNDDTPLTKEEVYSIVGAVIGRARIVEGRLLQWKRYEILSDLLHFVDDQEGQTIVRNHLKTYVQGILTSTPPSTPLLPQNEEDFLFSDQEQPLPEFEIVHQSDADKFHVSDGQPLPEFEQDDRSDDEEFLPQIKILDQTDIS
ncbi:MAG: hypothetical protein JSR39_03525 [Verrucomicrobia bacterium]|nr:hypothetical protein [Verrucomicrobiota bacterium]